MQKRWGVRPREPVFLFWVSFFVLPADAGAPRFSPFDADEAAAANGDGMYFVGARGLGIGSWKIGVRVQGLGGERKGWNGLGAWRS